MYHAYGTFSICMHALGINSQFLLGDQFWQAYVCQIWSPKGTIFGKGGPLLAAKISLGGPILAAKIGPGDHFWQFFAKIGLGVTGINYYPRPLVRDNNSMHDIC